MLVLVLDASTTAAESRSQSDCFRLTSLSVRVYFVPQHDCCFFPSVRQGHIAPGKPYEDSGI